MNIINFLKKALGKNNGPTCELNSNIKQEILEEKELVEYKNSINPSKQSIQGPYNKCEHTTYNDNTEVHKDSLYSGKWKAKDMKYAQLWNNDVYEPKVRNYTRRALIYRTPDYKPGGSNITSSKEQILLTINVEEGIVFLENYTQAMKIFESKEEVELFIQESQKKYDNELDMGIGRDFIFGWGGCMASLKKYENANIEYIPIIFPDNEKFRIPNYREKVEWSLIEKGAIMIKSEDTKPYLAVIQRKNKPRDLKPFLRYIV